MNTTQMIEKVRIQPGYTGIKVTSKGIADECSLDGPNGISVDIIKYKSGHERVSFHHSIIGRISRNKAERILGGENYHDVWNS